MSVISYGPLMGTPSYLFLVRAFMPKSMALVANRISRGMLDSKSLFSESMHHLIAVAKTWIDFLIQQTQPAQR